jgi:hypothetical protein
MYSSAGWPVRMNISATRRNDKAGVGTLKGKKKAAIEFNVRQERSVWLPVNQSVSHPVSQSVNQPMSQ